jgi:zinc transport system substrate-binding protein
VICEALTEAIIKLDPKNAKDYNANFEVYKLALEDLDRQYVSMISKARFNTLLFADRFPFQALVNDYGLTVYAAFDGCSAETEASFSTIIWLAEALNNIGLTSIMTTETSDQSIARTVRQTSASQNQQIRVLDSIKTVTRFDVITGTTYLGIMKSNLEVLWEALN